MTKCRRCDGCGLIDDGDDGVAWTEWTSLPPGADIAVKMGIVKPIPCPKCCPKAGEAPDAP